MEGLDGAHRVAQLRGLLVALAFGGDDHPALQRLSSSSLRPSRKSWVSPTARPYSSAEQMLSTHGAMQRLMSYSRQGRSRLPVITSLHDRIPNSRCVRAIVLRANRAGMNGPA